MGANPPTDATEAALSELARRVARRLLVAHAQGADSLRPSAGVHLTAGAPRPGDTAQASGTATGSGRALIGVEALERIPDGGELTLPEGALVTPLARDEAERRGIRLLDGHQLALAIGADHGGFALKTALVEHLRRRGLCVHDLGTHDDRAVDYPDYAQAVAREVAAGRAVIGVSVDGAGIGSAMAANKVPGVRAANCSSVALAHNAREHNHANVLTLGAGQLEAAAAIAILDAFLATPFGPGRHARRVAKIDALDARPGPAAAH